MSFAILGNEFRRSGNEFRHSGNEFRHFLGNEFRQKRTKKNPGTEKVNLILKGKIENFEEYQMDDNVFT